MILIADSGSTKTTWKIANGESNMFFTTQGINPFHMEKELMHNIVSKELFNQQGFPASSTISEVYFYGAGCTKEKAPILQDILEDLFQNANTVTVDSDILGAAKALFGNKEGIACILGTGANSCLYDGKSITENVSPMGYILGDEGSGAVLGKTFINLLYKGYHQEFIETFKKETGLTAPIIIQKVYREIMPNRFLASLCPFIHSHLSEEWIENMVINSFRLFFRNNVRHYNRPDLPCSFVGSIAFYFEKQLRAAAIEEHIIIGTIKKEPLG